MKNALISILLLVATAIGFTAEFPLQQAQDTESFTLLSANNGTNASTTSSTVEIERQTWHTFYVVAGTTNASTVSLVLKTTLDKTNFATVYSLVFTNIATTNTFTNIVGKFKAVQAVLTGTNTTANVFYLGQ